MDNSLKQLRKDIRYYHNKLGNISLLSNAQKMYLMTEFEKSQRQHLEVTGSYYRQYQLVYTGQIIGQLF